MKCVTVSKKTATCTSCKEEVKIGERIYFHEKLDLSCHLSCGAAAKAKSKKSRKATQDAQARKYREIGKKREDSYRRNWYPGSPAYDAGRGF